jgi:hypothetical protein
MNYEEVGKVLAKIKVGDNRQVDDQGLVLSEWFDSIGDLDFADAIAAVVLHRRESTEYLLPAHVRAGARRARDSREREERKRRPAIKPEPFMLDRVKFEAETQTALLAARAAKAVQL